MQEIWEYYKGLAEETGRDPETGDPMPFSLEFFFSGTRPQDQNPLVRAFLGDPTARLEAAAPPAREQILRCTSRVTPLYGAQIDAIAGALSYPVSLIQGPPGTGKTETILNLLSTILTLYPGRTVAVVPPNNEAIRNIVDKIEKEKHRDPMLQAVSGKIAVLGRKSLIRAWRKAREAAGEDVRLIDEAGAGIDPAYLRRYPAFSSTIHSLRRIFRETDDFHQQFDFVIADECSQMSLMLGVLAMSCAKNMVLLGDNRQLPPVVTAQVEAFSARCGGVPELYREAEGKSFLRVCETLFPRAPRTFLNEHYRCHPSIIGFCNQYVYNGSLTVRTPDDGTLRMRAVWYEGDYCEKVNEHVPVGEETDDVQIRRRIYNKRQIELFVRQELPRLVPHLQDPNFTAAVISPFRIQIEMLGQRLRMALPDCEIADNLDEEDIPRLTIHKAQGKGFDAVYFLPVEDYYREDPWCQRQRMINVAVSRAKREFCIITSSQWLPEEMQRRLTGYILPNGEEHEPDERGMYCRKLLRYMADHGDQARGEYGFHRGAIRSVFDRVPRLRRVYDTAGEGAVSAPARCVAAMLFREFGEHYTVLSELPLRAVRQAQNAACPDEELRVFRENSRFDFALCEGNRICLLIEVDGAMHRDDGAGQKENDGKKDYWVRTILQAGDRFLRLPTDGSTENEEDRIRECLAAARSELHAEEGIVEALAVKTRAQYTMDLLREEFADRIDTCFAAVRAHFERTDLDAASMVSAVQTDYTRAEEMTYSSRLRTDFYLCRYGVAYAFEYAMLYDLALRIRLAQGGEYFSVFSFGAGSLLDAWALAYAKMRLVRENPACARLRLYYKGVDEQLWNPLFLRPGRIYEENAVRTPDTDGAVGQTDGLFEKLWLYHRDIGSFLREDICGRRERNFYYNTLVFPKIINELRDEDLGRLLAALSEANFNYDEYYLLVSHSKARWRESAQILRRILGAINRDGSFAICCDCRALLGTAAYEDFERTWFLHDRLVSLAQEEEAPLRCYAFESGMEQVGPSGYIDRHNADFGYDAPRDFLQAVNGRYDLRASQVRRVNHIVFDVIRLKRRDV